MPIKPGDRVEVTRPIEGFQHREGETGTVTSVTGTYVLIEDEDGHRSTHYAHELTAR
ncbi:hypothetical protein [Streptomyces vinaceus]|uniref:hypothetical protein n=1 Tax=Streptomyces vinaceus TaxID=1960 RepID=UPI003690C649